MTDVTGAADAGGQQVLGGMPRRLFPCTPSLLTTWLECPRRYRMTYLDRPPPPKGPPWAHNSFGTTVHNALRLWATAAPRDRTPERAGAAVDLAWIGNGYRDPEQEATWRVRAREMVARYVATCDPHTEPVGVERTVAVVHEGMALRGRVDRIDERGDEVVVVDYKTGRHRPTTDDARGSLALAVYAHATERTLRRPCRTVELHHLPSGTVVSWTHTESSTQRHLGRAAQIAAEARDATEFPARPGPQCSWCDVVRVCEEGRAAAGRLRQPWEGLDD